MGLSRSLCSSAACILGLAVATSGLLACVEQPPKDDDSPNSVSEEERTDGHTTRGAGDAAAARKPADQLDGATRKLDAGRDQDGALRGDAPPPARDGQPEPTEPTDAAVARADGASPAGSSFAASKIVPHPSWSCGMAQGIPSPLGAPLAFTAELAIREVHELGRTPVGERRLLALGAGKFEGSTLQATLLPGGLDLPVTLANGAVELEQILMLETSDGAYIYLRVCGTAPNGGEPVRVVMDFEAPTSSSHAALNSSKLVGTRELDLASNTIKLRVHDISAVASSEQPSVRIENPSDAVDQTWECKSDTGSAGAMIYTEVVDIGDSWSVGASKRGNRNVIPILGGTATGRIKGTVLSGGADFQLLDLSFFLDARYTLRSEDGELILVRNCGPALALVPVFETRSDGPYAFLNENRWLSSSPSLGLGTVTLTISEKR